ncbi:MAG: hypothetical protein ACLFR2_04940 [Candidatus Kapaibacterium sp.]
MYRSIVNISCFLIVLFLLPEVSNAVPPRDRIMENLMQIKKVKMLDFMDMEREKADKFLLLFNDYEDRTMELEDKLEDLIRESRISNMTDKNDKALKKNASKIVEYRKKLDDLLKERHEAFLELLGEEGFAKYTVFEKVFDRELKRMLWEKSRDRRDGKPLRGR